MTRPKIIPRNPYLKLSGPSSEVVAKNVFRLLRSSTDFPVYREVELSRGVVRNLIGVINHCGRVSALSDCIKSGSEIDWDNLAGIAPEPEHILDRVFDKLEEDYITLHGVLTETMVARIRDAALQAYYQDFIDELLKQDPESPMDFLNRGNAYCENGDHDAAIRDYTRAIEMVPGEVTFRVSRASCQYLDKGDLDSALIDATGAVELCRAQENSANLCAFVLRAQILADLCMWEESLASVQEFIRGSEVFLASATWDERGIGTMPDGNMINAELVWENVESGMKLIRAIARQFRDDPSKLNGTRRVGNMLKNLRRRL